MSETIPLTKEAKMILEDIEKRGKINKDGQVEIQGIKDSIKITKDEKYSFLNNLEIRYDNINQGEHEDFWYFGKLFSMKGEEKEGIIICSKNGNKDILINNSRILKSKGEKLEIGENQIKQFGLNYKHSLEVNKNYWSNNSIKKWVRKTKKITREDVYNKIKETIQYYMDVSDKKIYDVVTCWVIASYCYEMFETFGYLYFHALRESGKSKFKKILRLIGFNGQEASSISEASFFRTIENTKGLLCIDEYERMDTDRKKSTDLLLNAGIEKGSSVKRVDKIGDKQVNRDFDVYCPKIICNITGLDPVTQSRCITIRLSKTAGDKGKRKPKTNDKIWQDLRDLCYNLIMDYWGEIKDIYDNYSSPLKNRDEDVWNPVLVMSKFFGVENNIKEFAESNIEESQLESIENDRTYLILKELLEYSKIPDEERPFHLDEIVPYLGQRINFGEKNAERVVGWHISNLNIFKKSRDGKGVTYKLSKKNILMALVSRGYPIPEEYQKSVKELHNHTQSTLTTKTTQTTPKSVDNVVNVVNVVNVGQKIDPKEQHQAKEILKQYLESGQITKEYYDNSIKQMSEEQKNDNKM